MSITKIQPHGKEIDICYDPPKSGNFNLELFRKGENGKESIPLEAGSQSLNFPDTQRRKSTVKLKVDISNFVVEGVLHEVV